MKRRIAKVSLAVTVAVTAFASFVTLGSATPVSPGACHMLEANGLGLSGMDGSQGGKNMVPLVVASLEAGCTP